MSEPTPPERIAFLNACTERQKQCPHDRTRHPATWVVIIGKGVWAKCYGPFHSYDAAMVWVRANQFEMEDKQVFPVSETRPPV